MIKVVDKVGWENGMVGVGGCQGGQRVLVCAVTLFAGFSILSQTVGLVRQWSCVLSLGFWFSVEKLDYCVQGQGHSRGSKCRWMFVWMLSSEPQNILLPSLLWWCSIMSQSVMRKKTIVCCHQGEGHSKGSCDQNMTFSLYLLNCWFLGNVHLDNISSTAEPFVTKLVRK